MLVSDFWSLTCVHYALLRKGGRVDRGSEWMDGWLGRGMDARLTIALLLGVKKYASLMYPSR